ncbi:hypothetical protein D046_3763, partial [Vibrio parahaemolyticus V-223/04]
YKRIDLLHDQKKAAMRP